MTKTLNAIVEQIAERWSDPQFVLKKLYDGENPFDVSEICALFKQRMITVNDVARSFRNAMEGREIGKLRVLIAFLVTLESIDDQFTHLLCEVLALREMYIDNEDVIELLGQIGDERAVPYLVDVIYDESFPGIDENRWAARKAVAALAQIGSDFAINEIRKACTHESNDIREECRHFLEGE